MTNIDLLNRRFGDSLGRPNGNDPRFAWKFAPEVFWYFRPNPTAVPVRHCWGDRIGKCWMLCQWMPTEMTQEQWESQFRGRYRYPGKGEYKPHPETALPAGVTPNDELTAAYIRTLRAQIEQSEMAAKDHAAGRMDAVTAQCEMDARSAVEAKQRQFTEMVADWEPLSWKLGEPHAAGDHDGPVSFGGI